jgi:deoxyribose-phosphate aldolase
MGKMIRLDKGKLAKMIDHTELSAQAGEKQIAKLCSEARTFGFHAVCVNGGYVRYALEKLQGSGVLVCSVVGFPLGAGTSTAKAFEAKEAVANGASEIDMMINIGALHDRKLDSFRGEICSVVDASRPALVKVILETCFLTEEEIVTGCELAVEAGARYVKTSTGFGAFGALPAHMRRTVGPDIGVKASGGIRNLSEARRLIQAGASRLGLSASVAVIEELTPEKLGKLKKRG